MADTKAPVNTNKQWRVYKPNKSGTGAASRVEFRSFEKDGRRAVNLFWVAAPEIPSKDENAAFAWSDKDSKAVVTLKMGETDIGELLAVLNRQKDQAGGEKGIYHKNAHGNTTFSFQYNKESNSFYVRLATKREDGKLVEVKHTLSMGEAQILRVLLTHAIERTYDWY